MSEPTLQLVLPPEPAQPAARGLKWIDSATAAARSGKVVGSINRDCMQKWVGMGLARQQRPEGGGKARWFIREDADPSFAAVKLPEQMAFDRKSVSDAQWDEVICKEAILNAWHIAREGGFQIGLNVNEATDRFLTQLEHLGIKPMVAQRKVKRATLYLWHAAYRLEGRKGLLDGRGKTADEATDQQADPFRKALVELFLTSKLSKSKCFEVITYGLAREHGWIVPGSRTARRWLEELDPAVVTRAREGKDAMTNKHDPYITRDYSSIASNEWWCSDHHRFDVMVALPPDQRTGEVKHARPWLHAWQDVRSRKIVGWSIFLHDPNADVIRRVAMQAISDFGRPDNVLIDNGKDYDSKSLQGRTKRQRQSRIELTPEDIRRVGGAFTGLEITIIHAMPYHGQSKPIERFFGTVCDRFSKMWDTYVGRNTVERPECLPENLAGGKAPTLEEFTAAFSEWLASDYHGRAHLGDSMNGQTPDQIYDACLTAKKVVPAAELEFWFGKRTDPVKVGQNGVTYKGHYFGATDPTLIRHFGEKVILVIPPVLTHVTVCDLSGKPICRVAANKKTKWAPNDQDVREGIAEKKKAIKAQAKYDEARPKLAMDVAELSLQAAHRRAGERRSKQPKGLPPAPIQLARTPFESVSNDLQNLDASPMKIAAGGEHQEITGGFVYRGQELTSDE